MQINELWRFPVKSLRGEQVTEAEVTANGIVGDRRVAVASPDGYLITSRTHPRLLGLQGGIGQNGEPTVNGLAWHSEEAGKLIQQATKSESVLVPMTGDEGFDVLPLLVATDGTIDYLGIDSRRFRPNIIVGDVPGLTEREWPGGTLIIDAPIVGAAAEAVRIRVVKLRARCVMTTYDPDTLRQDMNVLRRIVSKLDGTMALDCSVETPGRIRVGDPVDFLPAEK
jgi:uncharacterized protein YcbX